MTAEEIAETLIIGNISDAREAILKDSGYADRFQRVALLTLDVVDELGGTPRAIARVRRCLQGGT